MSEGPRRNGGRPSRRDLAAGLAAAGVASNAWAASAPRASDVAARIVAAFGQGRDAGAAASIALGAPMTRVTGVAVTSMPSVAVLREAQARGLNMVLTNEAPLFAKPLSASPPPLPGAPAGFPRDALAGDGVREAKRAFVEKNGLLVCQLTDTMLARAPDLMVQGMARAMGWPPAGARGADPRVYSIAPTTLRTLIASARRGFGAEGGLRHIGDPEMVARRVLVIPGTAEVVSMTRAMPGVDLVLTGDIREWEGVNYVYDSQQVADKKALIAVGRYLSEQPGMVQTAEWLRPALRGLRVEAIAPKDPYWRLA